MTFRRKFEPKKLLVSSIATLALSLTVGVFAPVAAVSGNAVNPPVVASQCDHPGYAHFGFASRQACLNYVASHSHGNGQSNGYGGGNNNNNHPSVVVTVQNVVNSIVNVTVNFVSNLFSS
jgi:hypothetical protein